MGLGIVERITLVCGKLFTPFEACSCWEHTHLPMRIRSCESPFFFFSNKMVWKYKQWAYGVGNKVSIVASRSNLGRWDFYFSLLASKWSAHRLWSVWCDDHRGLPPEKFLLSGFSQYFPDEDRVRYPPGTGEKTEAGGWQPHPLIVFKSLKQ